MGQYKIKVLQIAQDDMKSIITYIRMEDPEAAIRTVEKIKAAIGNLANFPLMGTIPRDKKIAAQGYRMIVVEPYLVFYILVTDDNTVEIHRVLHGRRNHSNILW